jgi:hypothetical protein
MRTQREAVTLTIVNLVLLAVLVAGAFHPSRLATAASPRLSARAEAQEVPVLRTRRLEIVDERGQIRSRLNVESDGEVVLRMADHNGTIRVKLGAAEGGSGLLLLDEATEPGVHIMARRTGTETRPTTTSLTLRAGSQQQVIRP